MDSTTTGLPSISTLHSPARRSAQRLRNILRLNAATSMVTGLVMTIAPSAVDRILGTGQPGWVRVVGLGLFVFAVEVAVVAGSRTSRLTRWSPMIIAADTAWVATSVATTAAGWFAPQGAALAAATAGMVATFAVLQWRHYARLRHASSTEIEEQPPIEITAFATTIVAPTDQVWLVITDHDLYGRLAPNLSAVQATGPDGPGLTRTCTSRNGQEWHETCTLWDNGHRYEVAVDTSSYPYPLTQMRGAWYVEPTGDGQRDRRHAVRVPAHTHPARPSVRHRHAPRLPARPSSHRRRMAPRRGSIDGPAYPPSLIGCVASLQSPDR